MTGRRRVVEGHARTDVRARSRAARTSSTSLAAAELARALERGELTLQYQPIVDLRSGECRRFEALLRWRHPRRGVLFPGDFMPLAASADLLGPIGRWVIESAARQWLEWRAQGEALGISVNVAGPEIASTSAVDDILAWMEPLAPDALTFELTAARLAAHRADALAAERLAAAGARIALDDVGAADAPGRSLASGLDELKLSRALTSRATADASARADLRALIELGRDYRLTVVAVGVEDKATYDLVASLGCDLAQGYWVSRPLVPDRLGPWRRWVAGVAFTGALALAAQVGTAKAAASGGGAGAQATASVRGFLPSMCCLELPSAKPDPSRSVLELLRERTGATFVHAPSARADVFTDARVSASVRADIVTAVDRDMSALEGEFGQEFTSRPAIYVFATRTGFAQGLQQYFGVRGPDAGLLAAANGGVTLPRQGAIVINLQNLPSDSPLAIVKHELTHALVHQTIGLEATLPAWFDEGLATLQEHAGESSENTARHAAVTLSLLTDGRTSLSDLSVPAQWAQRNAVLSGQGYTVAAEAVRLLEQRVGPAGLIRVLEATGRGESFGAAYAAEAGESLEDFERAFPARLVSAQEQPRILQSSHADGVRWTAAGFRPASAVTVTIEGAAYRVQYEATTDRLGMYQAVFGSTAPPGEYTIHLSGGGLAAGVVIRT